MELEKLLKPKDNQKMEEEKQKNDVKENIEPKTEEKPKRSGKYKTFTPDEKRELLRMSMAKGQNIEKIANLKGIAPTNLRRWKEEFEKDPSNFGIDERAVKAGRKVKYPEVDEHIKE